MEEIPDPSGIEIVEISYKQGARKEFCHCPAYLQLITGDMVVVDEGNGYNVGRISHSGELIRLQMREKRVAEDRVMKTVVRKAGTRDLERLTEARGREKEVMVQARVVARTLGVELKVGDVEFRGDGRKATFYYTADGRVDFRELVRAYARDFRVKIEMRQIGARQESSRIGGLGACGRELCCSTWLTDFKSVTTSAARYQNLSINQTKLSGQCGRLKCCLNYELDTYVDALKDIPKDVDRLKTEIGTAVLIKTDIFRKLLYYAYQTDRGRSNITAVPAERVKEIKDLNRQGEIPEGLLTEQYIESTMEGEEVEFDFNDDVTGVIELPAEKKRRRGRRKGGGRGNRKGGGKGGQNTKGSSSQGGNSGQSGDKTSGGGSDEGGKSNSRRRGRGRGRGKGPQNQGRSKGNKSSNSKGSKDKD